MCVSLTRCPWARKELDVAYHDEEWGVPVRDDVRLYEMLTLEGAQAGLSWSTILAKREGYRRAFCGFDPTAAARLTDADVERLLDDASIVRHRGKIESTIANASAVLRVQDDLGSLSALVWSLVDDEPRQNRWEKMADVPVETAESKALSTELKKRGFRFVGPTTVYAFMQACGMVNDHLVSCHRWEAVRRV